MIRDPITNKDIRRRHDYRRPLLRQTCAKLEQTYKWLLVEAAEAYADFLSEEGDGINETASILLVAINRLKTELNAEGT